MTPDEIFNQISNRPTPAEALGIYRPVLLVDNLAYFSGHGPRLPDGTLITGRVGESLGLDEGKAAARQVGLSILASLQQELGSLNRVKRLVKLLGLVNCTADFSDQPAVMNGCSELFVEVFGQVNGIGVRSALGTNALPGGIPVEIEGIVEV